MFLKTNIHIAESRTMSSTGPDTNSLDNLQKRIHTQRTKQGEVSTLHISSNQHTANRVSGPLSKTNAKPIKIQLNQGFFRLQDLSAGQSLPP